MNNSELEAILRKARTPECSGDFFETFPHQVARQLNRTEPQHRLAKQRWSPQLAWGLATAICILAALAIGHWRERTETAASNDILENAKFIRETLAMFPNQVRAIVSDKHGLNLILSKNGDVPASPPIYIRIRDGENCSSCLTFSGQEIRIAGQQLTVLTDAQGGIIVEGNQFVWSSDGKNYAQKNLKIEAKNLGTTL